MQTAMSTAGEISYHARMRPARTRGPGAIAYAARTLKLVVEPGGAVALASILAGRIETGGRTIAVVVSGGNIDDELLRDVLAI